MTIFYFDPNRGFGGDGASWASAFGDLTEALAAVTTSGDQIWFKAGVIETDNGIPEVSAGVELYGGFNPDESETAINQRNLERFRTEINGNRTYRGLSIQNGVVVDGFRFLNCWGNYAGGIFASAYDNWTISDCVFRNCRAIGEGTVPEGMGGAVYGMGCTGIEIVDCVFGKCRASVGGAALSLINCNGEILRCRFSGNYSTGYGGAIAMATGSVGSPYLKLINSLLDHNRADTYGGGIYISSDALTYVTGCTIMHNHAGTDGGGIYGVGSTPDVYLCANSIIRANTAGSTLASDQVSYQTTPIIVDYSNIESSPLYTGTGNVNSSPTWRADGAHPYDIVGSSVGNDAANENATGYSSADFRGRTRYDDPEQGGSAGSNPELWDNGNVESSVSVYLPSTYCNRSQSSEHAHGGTYALKIASSGGYSNPQRYVTQDHDADFIIGHTYIVDFWVYTHFENEANNQPFRVKRGGDSDGTGGIGIWSNTLTNDTWTHGTFSFTPTTEDIH